MYIYIYTYICSIVNWISPGLSLQNEGSWDGVGFFGPVIERPSVELRQLMTELSEGQGPTIVDPQYPTTYLTNLYKEYIQNRRGVLGSRGRLRVYNRETSTLLHLKHCSGGEPLARILISTKDPS